MSFEADWRLVRVPSLGAEERWALDVFGYLEVLGKPGRRIFLNPADYRAIVPFGHGRFDPETRAAMLRMGWMGVLEPSGQPLGTSSLVSRGSVALASFATSYKDVVGKPVRELPARWWEP